MSQPVLRYFGLPEDCGDGKTLSPRRKITATMLPTIKSDLGKLTSGMEMTVTFKNDLMCYDSKTITDLLTQRLLKSIKKYDFSLMLVGEFSETGRYHMHGMIIATGRVIDHLKRVIRKDFGIVQFRAISFTDSYIGYILKDMDNGRTIYTDEIIKIMTVKNNEPLKIKLKEKPKRNNKKKICGDGFKGNPDNDDL